MARKKKQEGEATEPLLLVPKLTTPDPNGYSTKSLKDMYCTLCRTLTLIKNMSINKEGYYYCKKCQSQKDQ